jgi:hypothetical protein
MNDKPVKDSAPAVRFSFHFHLSGPVLLSIALLLSAGLISYSLFATSGSKHAQKAKISMRVQADPLEPQPESVPT